jgi:hypothetical protein
MTAAKSYFQDRLVLLLLSVNAFLAFLATLLILLRIGSAGGSGFIVQCRDCSNASYINRFSTGHAADLLAFIVYALIVFSAHAVLSWRSYHIRRQLSLTVLALGTVLLLLCIIVSNALLALR